MRTYDRSWVALATPFRGGKLDEAAYRALCEEQNREGGGRGRGAGGPALLREVEAAR